MHYMAFQQVQSELYLSHALHSRISSGQAGFGTAAVWGRH